MKIKEARINETNCLNDLQVKLEQTEKHRDLYKKEGDKRQEHIDDLREQMDHQKDQLIAFGDRHDQEHKMLTTILAG